MGYAIGCLGSPIEMRTAKPKMTVAQRAKNNKLVPRLRNQTRSISFIEVSHDGDAPKIRAIKNGHLGHYASAFYFGKVRYLTNPDGTRIVVKNPRAR